MSGVVPNAPRCAPLCGASKAYGKYDQPWKHEPECPVRLAWHAQLRLDKLVTAERKEATA